MLRNIKLFDDISRLEVCHTFGSLLLAFIISSPLTSVTFSLETIFFENNGSVFSLKCVVVTNTSINAWKKLIKNLIKKIEFYRTSIKTYSSDSGKLKWNFGLYLVMMINIISFWGFEFDIYKTWLTFVPNLRETNLNKRNVEFFFLLKPFRGFNTETHRRRLKVQGSESPNIVWIWKLHWKNFLVKDRDKWDH